MEKDPYNFLKLHLTKERGRREMARAVGRILNLFEKIPTSRFPAFPSKK